MIVQAGRLRGRWGFGFPLFSEVAIIVAKRSRSRGGRRFVTTVHKPHGVIQPRVQRVGPEHFGIVSVDCAKARFKWMLCDFYGKVLIPPTTVEHNRPELDLALAQLRTTRQEHDLRDLIVAVEWTGRYYHIPQRLFADNGDEVRIVHPYTTKQYRTTTDPGLKTDDTDLAAIHRGDGFVTCTWRSGGGKRKHFFDPLRWLGGPRGSETLPKRGHGEYPRTEGNRRPPQRKGRPRCTRKKKRGRESSKTWRQPIAHPHLLRRRLLRSFFNVAARLPTIRQRSCPAVQRWFQEPLEVDSAFGDTTRVTKRRSYWEQRSQGR